MECDVINASRHVQKGKKNHCLIWFCFLPYSTNHYDVHEWHEPYKGTKGIQQDSNFKKVFSQTIMLGTGSEKCNLYCTLLGNWSCAYSRVLQIACLKVNF